MPEEEKVKLVELFKKPNIFKRCWWRIENFFREWIYPAYSLKNSLFYRYDIVRMHDIPRTQYSDVLERVFLANMELLVDFMEKENPEKHVVWYKDEYGNEGHKYGEYEHANNIPILFPEYEGKYVMDILKELHRWWKTDYPNLVEEKDILLSFWCRYVCGVMKSKPWKGEVDEDMKERKQLSFWQKTLQFLKIKEYDEEEEFQEIVFDTSECPTSLDDFKDEQVNWEVIDKYLDGDRNNIFVERFIKSKLDNLVQRIEQEKQRNLHLFIEMRNYLWT